MADQEISPGWVESIASMAQLLAHPVRVRLIAGLTTGGPNGAARFSEDFGDVPIDLCAYHLGVLRDGNAAKVLRTRHVRGAREVTYRFWAEPRSGDAAALSSFLELFGGPNNWRDPNVALPLTLDGRGVRDLRKVLEAVLGEIRQIAAASNERRSTETKDIRAVVRLAVIQ